MDPDNYGRQFIINAVPTFGDVVNCDIKLMDVPLDVSPKIYEEICQKITSFTIRGTASFRCTVNSDGLALDKIDSVLLRKPQIQLCM